MSEKYDVLVVGAGPGGSTAAYAAAENGAKVLVLDKRRELGVPVQCGEALSEDILNELNIEPDPRWAINRIIGAKLVSPSGNSLILKEKRAVGKVGYILDRKCFDRHLAIRAARAGADIRVDTFVNGLIEEEGEYKGVTAQTMDGQKEYRADIIIAADGVMSKVARYAGLNTALGPEDIESGAQFKMVNVEFESSELMEFYFGSEFAPGGYVWVFPRGEDVANVGIGVLPERAEKNSIEYLKDFVKENPRLKDGKIVEINAGGVPVSGPLEKTVKDNIMVVGDAARQVNALTGGGMDWAMRAGNIAGEVAAEAINQDDVSEESLSKYEGRWREKMSKSLERYLKGKDVLLSLSDDELDDLAVTLQDVDFEGISLTQMLKVLAKAHPKLLWKLKGLM
ncbi:MAG: NAD(P)/FAD-dependent oxidoreductase [Hadesarchaea archaeon]|nr:NAD(P)/FAD-dependent oxidoreductase [Hadesarchaea archaeon]